MRWRAPVCLAAFVLGAALSRLPVDAALLILGALFALAWFLRAPHERHLRLLLFALALAGLLSGINSAPRPYPADLAERWTDREAEGWGRVREIPVEKSYGVEVVVDLLALRAGEAWEGVRGGAALRFQGEAPSLGETVHFTARFRGFRNLGIPGEYDQVGREYGRGVYLRGAVKPGQWKTVAPASQFERGLSRVRTAILAEGKAKLSPDSYAVFAGLALGEKGMEKGLRDAWRDAGVTHLVSISGLHLAIVFLVLKWLAKALLSLWPPLLLYVNAGWWSGFMAIPGVVVYTLISGSQPPTLRSLAMLVVIFLAQGLGRRVSGFGPLSWGALGLVAVSPGLIWAPGFQLSFAAVAGAIAWSRLSRLSASEESTRWRKAAIYVAGATLSSIVATVWTMPFTTFHFGQVSLIGIVANLPLIPFVSALLTPLCFFFACAVAIAPGLPLPWALVEYGCVIANEATRFFAAVPGAAFNFRIDMVEIGVFLIALVFGTVAWSAPAVRWRRRSVAALALCAAVLSGHEWRRAAAWAGPLRVDMLSVGQGDAVLVSSKGRHMLVDTGGSHGLQIYERVLRPYFISQRIGRLDKLLLSHPHEDHVGAARDVLENMAVGELIVPSIRHFREIRPEILATAEARGVGIGEWTAGETYAWQALTLRVLHPGRTYREAFSEKDNLNDISLVFEARTADGACVLFTGDAEEEAEHVLARELRPCELLKVGHHGSRTSSSDVLLEGARPRNALISAGFRNQFRHPHASTLQRLNNQKVGVWVTADSGTLTAIPTGNQWKIKGYFNARENRSATAGAVEGQLYSTHLLGIHDK